MKPLSPDELLALLARLGIAQETFHHPPIMTVEEGRHLKQGRGGGHSKNLYLTDKEGTRVLISALGEIRVAINAIGRALGTKRLSFVDADTMEAEIGVRPGSVTMFALANDAAHRVDHVVLDAHLMAHEQVWFHPLVNTATTGIARADVARFLAHTGHRAVVLDAAAPGPPQPLAPAG